MKTNSSSASIVHLSDSDLLSLYLSLAPAARESAFITTARAAEITGVSMRTIQLWIESGSVRAILVGRKYRIVVESLKAHLEKQMDRWTADGAGPARLAKLT